MPSPELSSMRVDSTSSAVSYTPDAAPALQRPLSSDPSSSATNSSLSSQKSSSCLENCLSTIFELFKKFGDWIRELLCCCSPSKPHKLNDETIPTDPQTTQDQRPLPLSNSPPLPVSAHTTKAAPAATAPPAQSVTDSDLAISKTEPKTVAPPIVFATSLHSILESRWEELCTTNRFPCSLRLAYRADHDNSRTSASIFNYVVNDKQGLSQARIEVFKWAKEEVIDMVNTRRSTEYAANQINIVFFAVHAENSMENEVRVSSNACPLLATYRKHTSKSQDFDDMEILVLDPIERMPLDEFNSERFHYNQKKGNLVLSGHCSPYGLVDSAGKLPIYRGVQRHGALSPLTRVDVNTNELSKDALHDSHSSVSAPQLAVPTPAVAPPMPLISEITAWWEQLEKNSHFPCRVMVGFSANHAGADISPGWPPYSDSYLHLVMTDASTLETTKLQIMAWAKEAMDKMRLSLTTAYPVKEMSCAFFAIHAKKEKPDSKVTVSSVGNGNLLDYVDISQSAPFPSPKVTKIPNFIDIAFSEFNTTFAKDNQPLVFALRVHPGSMVNSHTAELSGFSEGSHTNIPKS